MPDFHSFKDFLTLGPFKHEISMTNKFVQFSRFLKNVFLQKSCLDWRQQRMMLIIGADGIDIVNLSFVCNLLFAF